MTSTRMHRIEDAARLAMADFMAGDAPRPIAATPLPTLFRNSMIVVAVIAICVFGFSLG